MSTVDNRLTSTLVLKYQDGLTPAGGANIRQKTLNYVRPDVSHDDLYRIAAALLSLTEHPLTGVVLVDKTEILEEEEE